MPINKDSKTVLFDSALDTLEWLRKEGARVLDRREIRQQKINFLEIREIYRHEFPLPVETVVKDVILSIEVTESTLMRWRMHLRRLQYIIDEHDFQHGHRTNFYIEQQERHLKLLSENEMYRDLWNEVRNLRTLLGETNHWP